LQQFFQDGSRIEAAFRKYFHRADCHQKADSYTMLVCHANVIRYFVCRALQFPSEAWLRLSLHHASITWISIQPSGRVILRLYGDCGHMPPDFVTTSNVTFAAVAKSQQKSKSAPF
jgi:serine/threonine-protein phosphatase PGAM5